MGNQVLVCFRDDENESVSSRKLENSKEELYESLKTFSQRIPSSSTLNEQSEKRLRKALSRRVSLKRDSCYFTNYIGQVTDKYDVIEEEIGRGTYGSVRKCIEKNSGQVFAMKSILKNKDEREETIQEIKILQRVKHPNVITLEDVYEDEKFIHIITPFCGGGELFEHLISKIEKDQATYSEADAGEIIHKILDAIAYCHSNGIVHRDLKPENLMYASEDCTDVKVIDFGVSTLLKPFSTDCLTSRVGTYRYMSPEVLNRDYTEACDIWSIGVILYMLLAGAFPFDGDNESELFRQIQSASVQFDGDIWEGVSNEAKELIRLMLSREPSQRPTAEEALVHPWFEIIKADVAQGSNTPSRRKSILHTHFLKERLGQYLGMSRFKKAAISFIAQQLTRYEIGYLEEVFQQVDQDGNGVISLDELCEALRQEDAPELRGNDEETTEQWARRLLTGLDLDMNNAIDYHEFIAAAVNMHMVMQEENLMLAFKHFDKAGKGRITASDLEEIFGSFERAKEAIGDVDINSDGVIDYNEFRKMMRQNSI